MRIVKSLQFWVGLVLAAAAFVGVLVFAELNTPPTYQVALATQDIPAYTPIEEAFEKGYIAVDTQSFSPALLPAVVTAEDLEILRVDGVFVETVRAGEVLNRGRIATGANASKVRRLSLALTNPDLVIKTIPIEATTMPFVALGDVVDIYTTIGAVRASEMVTTTRLPTELPAALDDLPLTETEITPEPVAPVIGDEEPRTITVTVDLPITKRLVAGALVVRVNREQIPNPQYGAVTTDGQQPPAYIEGSVVSVDVLVPESTAESLDWAIFNGKMSIAVRPALWRETAENGGAFPETPGFTWHDFNVAFWQGRDAGEVFRSRRLTQAE
jgi:hypothetical protein